MKDAVQKSYQLKNNDEMKAALDAEQKAISNEKLELLVTSIPEYIKAVLKVKGGAI